MRDTYHDELDAISEALVAMTKLVGSAMSKATTALLDADLQLAEMVIDGDEAVAADTELDAGGETGLVASLVERAEELNGGPMLDDVAAFLVQRR